MSYEISGTEVGPYEGAFSGTPVVKAEGSDDDLAANYKFSYTEGKLNIVASAIAQYVKLEPADVTEVYDGKAHQAGTATATDANGKTANGRVQRGRREVDRGTPADITATAVADSVTVKVRASVEGTYTGYVEGTQELEITQRPVELTGSGWTTDQPYTGKAYEKTDFEVEEFDAEGKSGLVEGQQLSGVSYEISGTEVGPYEGAFSGTPVVKAEGSDDDLAANYKFSYTEGKLNIVASAIAQYVKLEPADVTEVYDGKAHQAGTATATDANGKTAKVEYSVDGEKWTEDPADITATAVADSVTVKVRASVEGTYTGYVEGTQELEITQRPVELTGSGWTTDQPYTGKAYEKTDFEVEEFDAEGKSGLVEGQQLSGVSYEISGTEVGPYEGAFSGTPVVKAEGSDDDLAANYKFSYTEGKLNIVASAIAQYVKLEPADVTEVYDGKAHQAGTATATDANGKTAKVEYSVDGEK